MIQYVSIKGGTTPVDFETAILNGKAPDGGLYVPTELPVISEIQLRSWQNLSYTDLAFEILSLFIDRSVISETDLKSIIKNSFSTFYHQEIIPTYALSSRNDIFIQELFHGPSLSFKDIAMGFVVNLFDYFLKRRNEKMSIIVATSGDTGPAAAYASIGKKTLDTWVLYPEGFVTEEQERQMTTIAVSNVHSVRITNIPRGSDDLDDLVSDLFANESFRKELNLSSVNSINWGRIMMQTVHYFYGYLQTVDNVGELLNFAVPTGAFGNLCAGTIAREMGLPVGKFIIANNRNACVARIFSKGIYLKEGVLNCPSSAIDISTPVNFWRYLYFSIGQKPEKIKEWLSNLEKEGQVNFDDTTHSNFKKGFLTDSISDELTIKTIKDIYEAEGYLLDPHAAVSVAAAENLKGELQENTKTLCLATAHPSKFPDVIRKSLGVEMELPSEASHPSIDEAKDYCQNIFECHFKDMYRVVPNTMRKLTKNQ